MRVLFFLLFTSPPTLKDISVCMYASACIYNTLKKI